MQYAEAEYSCWSMPGSRNDQTGSPTVLGYDRPVETLPEGRTMSAMRWPHRTEYLTRLWQEDTSGSTVAEQKAKIGQLREAYTFRQEIQVHRFLRAQPEIADFLLEAYEYLERYFGPSLQVDLEVVTDPEIECSEEMVGYIVTPLAVDDALAQLDKLDEVWFLNQLDRVGGRFNFNLEFV